MCGFLATCGSSVDDNQPTREWSWCGARPASRAAAQHHQRKLYMDETTLVLRPKGAAWPQADLQALVQQLLTTSQR